LRAREHPGIVARFLGRQRPIAEYDDRIRKKIAEGIWLGRADRVRQRRSRAINRDRAAGLARLGSGDCADQRCRDETQTKNARA
jgi:hypothetical protein